mmetsp:Transcript_9203/g.32446  ORF Transcript_9203/g.32446 Transcript_9203/m.32446 type:complete len:230 (+) Transcript_9203:604-1293(+)
MVRHASARRVLDANVSASSPLKPITSMPTDDVRPFSASWPWRNTQARALPRPSSSAPLVRHPTSVDLPESTLPIMATRMCSPPGSSDAGGILEDAAAAATAAAVLPPAAIALAVEAGGLAAAGVWAALGGGVGGTAGAADGTLALSSAVAAAAVRIVRAGAPAAGGGAAAAVVLRRLSASALFVITPVSAMSPLPLAPRPSVTLPLLYSVCHKHQCAPAPSRAHATAPP